ncbi:BC_2427 family protein [Bacillus wiedmannii]|uniref:BC_2427 family protein n=1 Tax=Bacillus wiedmannii TaxID=1890302 RepID=UPI003F65E1BE
MVMKNPWVGKKIWNKVYKGEILIGQEQSHEIRENKKSKKTELVKKAKAIQVEKEGKGPECEVKAIQAEKENKEPKSKKEEKAIQAEKASKELERQVKAIQVEKENKEPESKKEEKAIQAEKGSKELERQVKAIQTEKENKEPESKKEEKAIQVEKGSKESERQVKAIQVEKGSKESERQVKAIQAEKENKEPESKKEEKAIQAEKKSKELEPNKEGKANKFEKKIEKNVLGKEHETSRLEDKNIDFESKIANSVRSIEVKTPFSIISDVTSFKKSPNMNVKNQEVFVFRNEKDARGRELDSTLLTTMEYYHGEIDCNLVSSNLHEKRVLLELSNQKAKGNIEESWVGSSSWIPIHGIILEKEAEANVNNYITAKLPIEIGRYKGEISLIEKIVFKETVIEIKEVSQEIIVTNKEFLLPKIIKKGNNPSIIEKGSLRVEGYIFQCIEFTSDQSEHHDKIYQLMQNIVLELNVQLLQEQEVRVRIT